jgi:hypothetical protein
MSEMISPFRMTPHLLRGVPRRRRDNNPATPNPRQTARTERIARRTARRTARGNRLADNVSDQGSDKVPAWTLNAGITGDTMARLRRQRPAALRVAGFSVVDLLILAAIGYGAWWLYKKA